MPRPLWAGAISFGLVTIPVKIVSATEDHDVHFHRVHLTDMGRVRTRKICELDGEVVSQDEIGKGYEIAGGSIRNRIRFAVEAVSAPDLRLRQQGARQADLISFGRPFIANPDLVERLRIGLPITPAEEATFYAGGDSGYLTYPTYRHAA